MEVSHAINLRKISWILFSVLIVVEHCLAFDPNRKQSISTVLNSKWSSTPFALEISEFLGDVKNDNFWAFLDFLSEEQMVDRKMTDREFYDKLIEFTSRYILWFNLGFS